MPKITKRLVDDLQQEAKRRIERPGDAPAEKDLFAWDAGDGAIKGFGIRMKGSGAASYLVQYRNVFGQTRRMVIGKVGTLTPDQARELAKKRLASVAEGADPSAERHAAREAMTMSEICDWYLKEAPKSPGPRGKIKKASTLALDKGRIECHIKPLIGARKAISLTKRDVERLQADIAAGKTAKTKKEEGRGASPTGGTAAAARTTGLLGAILEFAQRKGAIGDNPARGVNKFPDQKRRRFLSMDEIIRLGLAMRDAEAEGENKVGIAAVRALLLTGCRRNEILALPRSWLDEKARCIRFEDTKSGAQLRAIGSEAAKHLAARPQKKIDEAGKKKSPWLFPADRGDSHFVGLPRVLDRLCDRAGRRRKGETEDPPKIDGVTLHTLRHTFAAVAAEMGFSELTIAGLLGHTVPGVTARYAHVPDSALVAAADRVAARIAALLGGREEASRVVEMRRA